MWQYRGEAGDLAVLGGAASFVLSHATRRRAVKGRLERGRGTGGRNPIRRPAIYPLRSQRGGGEEIGAFSPGPISEIPRPDEPAPRRPFRALAIEVLCPAVVTCV